MKKVTGMKLQRALQSMKMLDMETPDISNLIYNLALIEDFFETIEHIGALKTIKCARNILEQ